MTIGIDVSQLAYGKTGVANYLASLVLAMIRDDRENKYVLFFSSLRRFLPPDFESEAAKYDNVTIKKFRLPPTALNLMWNRVHKLKIEKLIGKVDFFITSDWAEPPTRKIKKATIIYDLIVYKNPDETDDKIVSTQRAKLEWVKKESNIVFCISESTKKDAMEILGIPEEKIHVIYPGITEV